MIEGGQTMVKLKLIFQNHFQNQSWRSSPFFKIELDNFFTKLHFYFNI